ncbi:hypothetical protein SAICODRAFT_31351 [Saitoella complicata NRRL Y-17804]|uniref:uncharacterized protein n=1 Tax=Saitoella complicata (strain BCRC 22490 / CBS 7301 / JCM 7358 / NBRC 10748 / NRRL Y-17804) TaxID=698492 RepID=UPI000866D28C|nr:uncharacterized protein SAICODRAFT_31351 [Saitoella complicata NRRL Y-17804]ODQ51409.1 hypothetical protein SAICODRAFT_31351 [Saitoella complicata NRRL Y-17804]
MVADEAEPLASVVEYTARGTVPASVNVDVKPTLSVSTATAEDPEADMGANTVKAEPPVAVVVMMSSVIVREEPAESVVATSVVGTTVVAVTLLPSEFVDTAKIPYPVKPLTLDVGATEDEFALATELSTLLALDDSDDKDADADEAMFGTAAALDTLDRTLLALEETELNELAELTLDRLALDRELTALDADNCTDDNDEYAELAELATAAVPVPVPVPGDVEDVKDDSELSAFEALEISELKEDAAGAAGTIVVPVMC